VDIDVDVTFRRAPSPRRRFMRAIPQSRAVTSTVQSQTSTTKSAPDPACPLHVRFFGVKQTPFTQSEFFRSCPELVIPGQFWL